LIFHKSKNPLIKVEPVDIYKLIEGGKPIYIITIKLEEDILAIDIDLKISELYCKVAEAFNSSKAEELAPYYKNNLEINLEPDIKLSFRLVYKLSKNKLELLYKYLNSSLISSFI
jgi:hypothetical protein